MLNLIAATHLKKSGMGTTKVGGMNKQLQEHFPKLC